MVNKRGRFIKSAYYKSRFEYMREWIEPNLLDGLSLTTRIHNLEWNTS